MESIVISVIWCAVVLLLAYMYCRRQRRRFSESADARLRYIRILCELVYTYSHNPSTLLKQLQAEMSVKKLLSYHVIEDRCDRHFYPGSKVNKKDQLFYMLHEEGFQPRELCVIFELNNLNSVYVKYHRVNRKIHFHKPPEAVDNR